MIDEAFQTIIQSNNNGDQITTLLREAMRTSATAPQREADARQADTRQADARQADTRQADTRQAHTRQADTRQADTRNPPRQPGTNAQVLDSWNHHVQDYHDNMRIYNQNVAQMTRISQMLIRNMNTEESRTSYRYRPRTARTINAIPRWMQDLFPDVRFEIQGFTFPPPTSQRLSSAEMYRVTETFNYTEGSIPNSNVCPITLEEFETGEALSQIRNCRHTFKKRALFHWFTLSAECPVCRQDVRQSPHI